MAGFQAATQQPHQRPDQHGQRQVAGQRRGQQPGPDRGQRRTRRTGRRQRRPQHGEPGQRRQQRQPRDSDAHRRIGEQPDRVVGRPLRPRAASLVAHLHRRRPGPVLALADHAEHRRTGGDLGAGTDVRAGAQGRPGADTGTLADPDGADDQPVAVQPVTGQIDLRFDRAGLAEPQQPGDRRGAVQVDVRGDPGAEQPGVPAQQHRTGDRLDPHLVGEALRQPQPEVDLAAAGILAGTYPGQDDPDAERSDQHPARGEDEQGGADHDPPPGQGRQPGQPGAVGQVGGGRGPDRPAQPGNGAQRQQRPQLPPLGLDRHRPDVRVQLGRRRGHLVQVIGERRQPRVVVDVGDRHLGVGAAQQRHHLGGGQRAAAEVEEVGVQRADPGAEHRLPVVAHHRPGARQLQFRAVAAGVRQRPGQGVPVDLARGAGGQLVDHGEPRHQRRRQSLPQQGQRGVSVEAVLDGQVADQKLTTRSGAPDGRRGPADAGQIEQGVVDLAELDPASADLDLVVGASDEQQPRFVVDHQVAGTVGALPAQRRQRGVLLGVLGRVEVAGQADPADDQLTGLARPDRVAGRVDDDQVPAVQRQPDPDRRLAGQLGAAGDHGGLGGPVGVPHLAVGGDQPGAEFGRARLATEDEQSNPAQRVGRPQRHQGRHGGDDRDPVGQQPRAQVHARPDQRARRRHQAAAVAPGQPHLLAGGVEGDRQPGHHPVADTQRRVGEVDARLGVHEGGGAAMADRDPLRLAGRTRGEDHPGVVVRARIDAFHRRTGRAAAGDLQVVADHGAHVRFGEHRRGPLVRVVGIHRHVGGAGEQDAHDRHVQVGGAGRDPHAHLVARADAEVGQFVRELVGGVRELGVGEQGGAVVERVGVRAFGDGLAENVDQGAGRRREGAAQQAQRRLLGSAADSTPVAR